MLPVDFHTHTLASGHAMNTIDEMLRYGSKMGMEAIAICEHGPGMDNTLWLSQNSTHTDFRAERIQGPDWHYFRVFLNRYKTPPHYSCRLFKGIESNILGEGDRGTDVPRSLAPLFDVVISSIHAFPHLFTPTHPDEVTARVIKAMDDPIDIIGHPFHKKNCAEVEPVVRAAAEKGITLELNNSSVKLGKAVVEKIPEMLHLAKKYTCTISVSSDAHADFELGQDESITRLLKEVAFPEELIVNRNLEAALEFIEERKKVRAKIVKAIGRCH